ncbi:MAG: hypothetical protein HON98_03270 [Chloroflexi bacterium]|jgi:GTPase SAR1 family protein|nr:hypothetical protein [Chloroflexota bacterium]MBT3670378.1 hypothetical protein [Chloroflexota bacterium]MBT4002047.1 hypothetical protein [Chloroflexota bacterium]MBT4305565.1 hypothetical protein [Chloroflexota bacterium]MBT4533177.1 hypothetical protein [Chloroflexota bacterium]
MTNPNIIRLTGFIMPVGNGAVGKTSVSRILEYTSRGKKPNEEILLGIQKTKNLEFEYATTNQVFGNREFSITLQFLVPPGQKEEDGDPSGRSFQQVIEIFKETIRRLDVVIFTYDLSNRQSFQDLEYWADAVKELLNDASHMLLLGTHLDRNERIELTEEEITAGLAHLQKKVSDFRPGWKGKSAHLEVSNLTGENLELLLRYISGSIISSRRMMR